jgi:co-chaperonin GroES (HSP10)
MTNYKPTKTHVLIEAYEWAEKSEGGIWFPETLRYHSSGGGYDPWRGKVLAIGSEVTQLSIGEIVRYQPDNYYATTIQKDGKRYIFLDETLVYAVEDDKENLVRALKTRVVISPEKEEEKVGSFYIPDIGKNKKTTMKGVVVAAGLETELSIGQIVLLENKKGWVFFFSKNQKHIITDVSNVLAICLSN